MRTLKNKRPIKAPAALGRLKPAPGRARPGPAGPRAGKSRGSLYRPFVSFRAFINRRALAGFAAARQILNGEN
ncbi:MAG: hypothetical protein DBY09_02560 [Selenomonadales bacterium]|nr:MAG: hypothetical protein DBY09_02560 [Selenomonadales bacterium]